MSTWDELHSALNTLYDTPSDFQTDDEVFENAVRMANALKASEFPVPRVWAHGPLSVNFDWGDVVMTVQRSRATIQAA